MKTREKIIIKQEQLEALEGIFESLEIRLENRKRAINDYASRVAEAQANDEDASWYQEQAEDAKLRYDAISQLQEKLEKAFLA